MKRPLLASRRTFTRYVGSTLAGALLAPHAFAQTPVRIHRIGILSDFDGPTPQQVLASPFRGALRELGYVEGKNIALVARYGAKGQIDRLREMVRELIEAKVDVIPSSGEMWRSGRRAMPPRRSPS